MPIITIVPHCRCTLTLVVIYVDPLQSFEISWSAETSIPSLLNKNKFFSQKIGTIINIFLICLQCVIKFQECYLSRQCRLYCKVTIN